MPDDLVVAVAAKAATKSGVAKFFRRAPVDVGKMVVCATAAIFVITLFGGIRMEWEAFQAVALFITATAVVLTVTWRPPRLPHAGKPCLKCDRPTHYSGFECPNCGPIVYPHERER